MLAFILVVILSNPIRLADNTVEYVDLIELNHFYDSRARLVFDQVIFYERAPESGRFQVRGWCMVEDRESQHRRPAKNETSGLYQVDWHDGDQRLQRRITSRLYRESWTHGDPERDNQKIHSENLRIGFVKRIAVQKDSAE